jgi:hypothetical protein
MRGIILTGKLERKSQIALFLKAYEANSMNMAAAARVVGITRQTVCNWRARYPDFNSAMQQVEETIIDEIESLAMVKAKQGSEKWMMEALRNFRHKHWALQTENQSASITIRIVDGNACPQQ